MSNLYVAEVEGKGRGVFTYTPIRAGDLIESCELILVPGSQKTALDQTILSDYYFLWRKDPPELAIALGNGSLFNHSFAPNAHFERDLPRTRILFRALRDIAKGEEITVNYNGEPDDPEPVWFEPHKGA